MPLDIVVTGVGIVSPAGCGAMQTWTTLRAGGLCVGSVGDDAPVEPSTAAGIVRNFVPPAGMQRRDRVCQFAVAAAEEAAAQAGLGAVADERSTAYHLGVSFGTSKGGLEVLSTFTNYLLSPSKHSLKSLIPLSDFPPDAPAREVALRLRAAGPIHVSVTACATGVAAVIRGAQMIADGQADAVICGSSDAAIHPLWLAAFRRMGVLAKPHPQRGPAWACRPFDRSRSGFVVGEGAGALVLESAEKATRRGGRPLARLSGYAMGSDPAGLAGLSQDGAPLAEIVRLACLRAGVQPSELCAIQTHGTGTQANDAAEIAALRLVCGQKFAETPTSSLKGAIGHLLGAAGSVELALTILSCLETTVLPNATLIEPAPALGPLRLPTTAVGIRRGPILKTSLGFGGHLAAVVISPL